MIAARSSRAGIVLAVVVGALLAASIAHFLIDALGDVVLVHDDYDGVTHGSRSVLAVLALVTGSAAAFRALLGALDTTATCRARLRACARAIVPALGLRFALATAALALVALAGMEFFDVHAAGADLDDPVMLVGGSWWLGIGTLVACAAGTAFAVRCGFVALFGISLALAVAVRALVTRRAAGKPASLARRHFRSSDALRLIVSTRTGKRGPPRLLSAR